MLTEVSYMYRDASNYKFHGSFIVDGELSNADLEPYLFDGESFVPTEVGLPHLLDVSMNEDDHWLHEFSRFSPISDGTPICTASKLIELFQIAHRRGWFSQLV